MRRFLYTATIITSLVLIYQNCAPGPNLDLENLNFQAGPPTNEHGQSFWSRMEESIQLECRVDSDCQQIAVGERACGGPSAYVIYSKSSSDVEQLLYYVDEITALEKERNTESDIASICSMELPYENLHCQNNVCIH